DEAQLAHRAEGEQELQVVLLQRAVAADEHGGSAADQDHPPPGLEGGECRCEPGDEIHACFDHGGGVQVGTDRGGGGHGRGEPEVEGDLCGFAEGTDEDQDDGDGGGRTTGRVGEQGGQGVGAAVDLAERD